MLSVVPYYNKPMQAGIQAHFRAIAISTALPIILHDVPSRTMRELSDDTLLRLASSRHFIGLKDGTGDIPRLLRLRPLLPAGFRLLSGDDATALPFIANGGDGCISIVSNVAPELCQAMFSNCRLARPQTARYLQDRLVPLTAALTKESPAALKYALFLLGFMSPATRLPIVELTDDAKAEVASAIAEIGDEDIGLPGRALARASSSRGFRGPILGAARMSCSGHAVEWYAGTLRAWHLAILRYAVTLDNADRLAVLRIAREIDGLYPQQEGSTEFEFFRRTSAELCSAILQPNERATTVLQQHLARIDDDRLKRAFAAAIDASQPAVTQISRPARRRNDLWKGLSSRSDH